MTTGDDRCLSGLLRDEPGATLRLLRSLPEHVNRALEVAHMKLASGDGPSVSNKDHLHLLGPLAMRQGLFCATRRGILDRSGEDGCTLCTASLIVQPHLAMRWEFEAVRR